jgi:hypothetical protein
MDHIYIVPLVKVLGWRKSAADFATSFGLLCIDVIQLSYPEKLNFSQIAPWVVLVVDSKQQNCSDLSLKLWNWLPIKLATNNLQTSQSCKSWVESLKRSVRFDLKVGDEVIFLTSSLPAVLLEIHSFYPGVPIGAQIQLDSGMIEKFKYESIHPRGSLASDNSCGKMSGSCFPTGVGSGGEELEVAHDMQEVVHDSIADWIMTADSLDRFDTLSEYNQVIVLIITYLQGAMAQAL